MKRSSKIGLVRRRICIPIVSRAYYGRIKPLLLELSRSPEIDLQIVLSGAVLLDKYGKHVAEDIQTSGFKIADTLFSVVDGGNHIAAAKSAALTTLEYSNIFYKLDPHIVVVVGDRFEQLAIASAATYLNRVIAHIEGGDRTGSIDEQVRHSITKLAHVHFPTNQDSASRLIRMGENPNTVNMVGSLDIESASSIKGEMTKEILLRHGVGDIIDPDKPFILSMYHPVTTKAIGENWRHVEELFRAVKSVGLPIVWFWPNHDAGSSEVSEKLRHEREYGEGPYVPVRFITNMPSDEYILLLKKASVIVGNSSSGIKEASFFGVPAVNVGDRQTGRLRGPNVIDVSNTPLDVVRAIKRAILHGKFKPSKIYAQTQTAKKITDILKIVKIDTQKSFYEKGR